MPPYISRIPEFDQAAAKYKCCCGRMFVEFGALIIGMLQLFGIVIDEFFFLVSLKKILNLPTWAITPNQRRLHLVGLVGGMVMGVVFAAIIIMLFFGLFKRKHNLVLPIVVVQGLNLIFAALLIAFSAFAIVYQASSGHELSVFQDQPIGPVVLLIYSLSAGGFALWFFIVYYKTYFFLYDLNAFLQAGGSLQPQFGANNSPSPHTMAG